MEKIGSLIRAGSIGCVIVLLGYAMKTLTVSVSLTAATQLDLAVDSTKKVIFI